MRNIPFLMVTIALVATVLIWCDHAKTVRCAALFARAKTTTDSLIAAAAVPVRDFGACGVPQGSAR